MVKLRNRKTVKGSQILGKKSKKDILYKSFPMIMNLSDSRDSELQDYIFKLWHDSIFADAVLERTLKTSSFKGLSVVDTKFLKFLELFLRSMGAAVSDLINDINIYRNKDAFTQCNECITLATLYQCEPTAVALMFYFLGGLVDELALVDS